MVREHLARLHLTAITDPFDNLLGMTLREAVVR